MNETGASRFSIIRDHSRCARERSRSLRISSQHLRESLEKLRAYAAEVTGGLPEPQKKTPGSAGDSSSPRRTPLDSASMMRERVYKARIEAQALRRRAADLRNRAAEFRARSENLRSNSATI